MLPIHTFHAEDIRSELDRLLAELQDAELREFPLKRRRQIIEANGYDDDLDSIRMRLEDEWDDVLVARRDSNSDKSGDSEQERLLFEQALLELLPLARMLTAARAELLRLREEPSSVPHGSVEDGIQAIQDGRWNDALFLLASVDAPADVLVTRVQWLRRETAERLLKDLRERLSSPARRPLSDQDYHQIEAITRIGTEQQRTEARRFLAPRSLAPWFQAVVVIAALLVLTGGAFAISRMRTSLTPVPTGTLAHPTTTGSITVTLAASIVTAAATSDNASAAVPGAAITSTQRHTDTPTPLTIAVTAALTPEPSMPSESPPTTPPTTVSSAVVTPITAIVTITPTSALALLTVRGVNPAYEYTRRIDSNGFTRMRMKPDASSERVGLLRNGDQVEVLRDDVDGWYEVRIYTSSDPAQQNIEGWIERWLVDDVAVPPPPPTWTPLPPPPPRTSTPKPPPPARLRTFVVTSNRSNDPSPPSGERQSCVTGRVVDRNGNGVDGARLYVNNGGPAAANPLFSTVNGGYYQFCGLGGSAWSVVLTYIPGLAHLAHEATAVIYVDGTNNQGGVVNFGEK